jgi:hypothetical protein
MTQEQKNKFSSLACQLSPENLTCDGELRGAQVRARHKQLMKEWNALEREVGRTVTEEETWDFEIKKTGGYWNN